MKFTQSKCGYYYTGEDLPGNTAAYNIARYIVEGRQVFGCFAPKENTAFGHNYSLIGAKKMCQNHYSKGK